MKLIFFILTCIAAVFISEVNAQIFVPFDLRPQISLNSITDVSCISPATGAIDVSVGSFVIGPPGPPVSYKYKWSNGATTEDISGLVKGSYTITATDAAKRWNSATFEVGTGLEWLNIFGNMLPDNANHTLKKTGANGWNGGVASGNLLPSNTDGWAEFKVGGNNRDVEYIFGLTDVSSSVSDYKQLNYAVYLAVRGTATTSVISYGIMENGQPSIVLGIFSIGDVFRVERKGVSIIYSRNGRAFYTTIANARAKNFKAEAFINKTTSYLINCRCNFGCPGIVKPTNVQYGVLKKQLDGGYVQAVGNNLYFQYNEEYGTTGTVSYKIYDQSNTVVLSNNNVTKQYGDNRYPVNVSGLTGFYVLEVTNVKNEKWYLRFKN